MEYLASMPPPVISITYKSVPLFTSLAPLIRFAVVSPYLEGLSFWRAITRLVYSENAAVMASACPALKNRR